KVVGGREGLEGEGPAVFAFHRKILDRHRIFGERPQPPLAAQAVSGPDLRDENAAAHQVAGGAAGAASPPSALPAAARSCAFFFGLAFCGLLRGGPFLPPASSRKRSTPSPRCPPLALP